MKTKICNLSALLLITGLSVAFTSCGGDEKPSEDVTKPAISNLFTDDRPDFDPNAVDPDAPVVEIKIEGKGLTMADMSYEPKLVTVKAGSTVKLTFVNTSVDESMPHNWVLVHYGTMENVATEGMSAGKSGGFVPKTKDVLLASPMLGPGEETIITFPAPPAGKYQFVCTYPGHWSIMNGEFIVE